MEGEKSINNSRASVGRYLRILDGWWTSQTLKYFPFDIMNC